MVPVLARRDAHAGTEPAGRKVLGAEALAACARPCTGAPWPGQPCPPQGHDLGLGAVHMGAEAVEHHPPRAVFGAFQQGFERRAFQRAEAVAGIEGKEGKPAMPHTCRIKRAYGQAVQRTGGVQLFQARAARPVREQELAVEVGTAPAVQLRRVDEQPVVQAAMASAPSTFRPAGSAPACASRRASTGTTPPGWRRCLNPKLSHKM